MRKHLLSLLWLAFPAVLTAQPGSSIPSTSPGRNLFVLDLAGTPLDEFPSSVKALSGVMTVVDKNGQRMLMATSPSEFLITLPQVLPAAFTIILDIVPKRCCAPDDIMLEGTPTMNRGPASAQLTWQPERVSAVGGSPDMYQAAMPDALAAATPGNPTQLVFEFNGPTIKLYTNGRRLYTLDKQFARGRVLRVWLGGESESNPAYLAGLRILPGAVAAGMIAQNPGQPGAPTPPPGVPSGNPPTPPPGVPTPNPSPLPPSGAPVPNPPPAPAPAPVSAIPATQTGTITPVAPPPPPAPRSAPTNAGPVRPGALVAGPATLSTANQALAKNGWGVRLAWSGVPNATGYQVNRSTVGSSAPSVIVKVYGPWGDNAGGFSAMDPFVAPNTDYNYWVEALTGPANVASAPSPISKISVTWLFPGPMYLRSTVSAPKLTLMRGALAGMGTVPASDVTWTWDPWPSGYSYEASFEIVGGIPGIGPVLERITVPTGAALPWSATTSTGQPLPIGTPSFAPVVRAVPQGQTVRFCVAMWEGLDRSKPLGQNEAAQCLTTQVP